MMRDPFTITELKIAIRLIDMWRYSDAEVIFSQRPKFDYIKDTSIIEWHPISSKRFPFKYIGAFRDEDSDG